MADIERDYWALRAELGDKREQDAEAEIERLRELVREVLDYPGRVTPTDWGRRATEALDAVTPVTPDNSLDEMAFNANVALPEAQERFRRAEAEIERLREALAQVNAIGAETIVEQRDEARAEIERLREALDVDAIADVIAECQAECHLRSEGISPQQIAGEVVQHIKDVAADA